MNKEINKLDKNNIPRHVAIIMDGNGRWAKKHYKERTFGHQHGVDAVRSVVEGASEVGIQYLTLYAFSTENWKRPKSEVMALMSILVQSIENERENLHKNNVRLSAIGNIKMLPENAQQTLQDCISYLSKNNGLNLVLALSYSAKWEITEAAKSIANKAVNGELNIEEVDHNTISNHLTTKDIPDPELLIRTSGEYRVSNFLLWQIAYTELYFTETLWPDYRKEDLFKAVEDYQTRERRFGNVTNS